MRPRNRGNYTCTDCGMPCAGKRCKACYDATRPPKRPNQPCIWCGTTTLSTVRVCETCKDIHAIPEPTSAEALTGGRWLRRGTRLVYLTIEDEIAEYERRRAQPLMTERYQRGEWWTRHGVLFDDTETKTALRMRDMVAEFDAHDGRVGVALATVEDYRRRAGERVA